MTRYADAYAAEISAFIDCINSNTAPSPSIRDGLIALRLADAALKSVASKAAVTLG